MRTEMLSVHPGLAGDSRLPALPRQGYWSHLAPTLLLLGTGVGAALATAFLDFSLRVPGHAIIRAVFPMAFGLALVPRRRGGLIMAVGAVATVLVIRTGGMAAIGFGAMTSLVLTGPLLDVALGRARRGWRLYLAFASAGLVANLTALAVRSGAKLSGLDHLAGRPLAAWLVPAVGTYALCGALAGLVSAAIWFQFSANGTGDDSPEAQS